MFRFITSLFQNQQLQFIISWNYSKSVIGKSKLTSIKSFNSYKEAFDSILNGKKSTKRGARKDLPKSMENETDGDLSYEGKQDKTKLSSNNVIPITEVSIPKSVNVCGKQPVVMELLCDVKDTERVRVYTDGSCKMSQAQGSVRRAGIGVYWGKDHALNVSDRYEGVQTNNRAEIAAATRAVQIASENGINKLTVVTDSAFLVNCMVRWLEQWKLNMWKLSCGRGPVQCRDELERLDQTLTQTQVDVHWEHVAGHSKSLGNREADLLATTGADKWLSSDCQSRQIDK